MPRRKNDRWKYAVAPVCAIALVSTGGAAKTGTHAKARPPNANVQVAANVPPKTPSAYIQIAANSSRINTTGRDITITVPMNNGLPLGQVDITITPDNTIYVKADDLIAALSRNLIPAELDRLAKLADARGRISAADLATAGYPISYDTASSTLQIALRLDGQRTIDINLGNSGSQAEVLADKSANFAAFLNYRAGETYTFTGPYEGRMAFLGDLELGGRIGQTVSFDNYGSLDQRNPNVFTRSSSRLIYDWPGPALRITAGDLLTDTTAFQSGPQIAGLNISHLMSTFYPSFDMSGAGNQNLVLTHASDVQIIVNNLPVSQLHLQPGTYNLRNLAMSQGSNNIKAIVTDDTGARRVVDFSYFSDANLLAPGLDEYTLSAGVLAPYGQHGPDYDGNAPVLSGYYRRGVTEQLTAGVNLQAGRYDQMLGLDAVFGTDLGLFSLNIAGNHLRYDVPGVPGNQLHDDVLGAAGRLQYRFLEQGDNVYDNRSFNASVEYRSPHFGSMATGPLFNDQAFLFSADLSQPISGDFSFQLSGNYATYRSHRDDTGAVSGFVNWSAPYDMDVGVGLTYQWSPRPVFGQPDLSGRGLSFAITLTKRLDETTLVQASGDRFNQRASITRSPTHQLDDWFASGDVGRSRDGYSGSANLGYETNRGDVQAAYSTGLDGDGRIVSQTLGGIFTGSVAFADGHVGLGRSISDSFAIIDTDPSLGDSRVLITDGFADNVSARSDALGPAVVRLNSYSKQTIPYDVDDLPAGYNLGDGNFADYPWYHSGAAFTVGSPYNVSALGIIVDASGAPVTLQTGEAVSLDDPTAPHVPVVTNRTGHFAVIGLAPGRWRMTMSGGAAYVLTVRKEDGMLLKLGTVSPTP